MKTKVQDKNSKLTSILAQHFGCNMNLARIKFFGMMICALCKVQTVGFEKLATAFETQVDTTSSLRRIQRFMAGYMLNTDLIARLIFALLPHKPPYTLTMDRTNWKFGQTDINILVIAICYQGVAFEILFTLMPKRGNSNTAERIALVRQFMRLFGCESIECLVADREFVGKDWIGFLNDENIEYHIRIRDNFHVDDPHNGHKIKVSWLFGGLREGERKYLRRLYRINSQLCYLSGSKVRNKEGMPELQILVSFRHPEKAGDIYRDRWQIESAFRALKTSGFNIEATHLSDLARIEKLFAIVLVAFTWSYVVGDYIHRFVRPIRLLKHGYHAKSLFKYGLNAIAKRLLNKNIDNRKLDVFKFLSCT